MGNGDDGGDNKEKKRGREERWSKGNVGEERRREGKGNGTRNGMLMREDVSVSFG